MRISYNWLKQFIKTDWTSEQTSELLTDLGLEVEGVIPFESLKGGLKGVVVGHVLTCVQHPNADRLRITTVDLGNNEAPVQIVCGAPNVAAGQKVPVATIGTTLYDKDGNGFEIKKGKIRGEESHGMICAEDELGIGQSHEGILVLPEDTKIGTNVADLYDVENDEVFEIGLTPNRADAMSHFGVARDLRAGLLQQKINLELITPSVNNFRIDKRTLKIDVDVENEKNTPRYTGVSISGVTVKTSPNWLQNRLKSIGLTPKNNIVDITNYVMHELGQPLHAFDANSINGNKIIVKNATANTKFTTLDGIERTLHQEDVMICDAERPLCIAGVLGGLNSGVSENTQNIFLESAYFNPVSIRKTAKRHAINTDASFRFERGIDINLCEYALKKAAILIQEMAGGEITSDISDFYPKKAEDFSVFLNFEKVNRVIGEVIPAEVIKNILVSLEIKVTSVTNAGLGLIIPSYRVDVQREVDVIEEILRVYGYNTIAINEKFNATVSPSARTEEYKVQNKVADQLCALGFNEIMANSLTSKEYLKYNEALKPDFTVQMLNPLSSDLEVMRQSMLFSGLEAVNYNINRKNSDLRFFEFGKIYNKFPSGYEENKKLTLFVTGNQEQESWSNTQLTSGFFNLKKYVQFVLQRLNIEQNTKSVGAESPVFSEAMAYAIGKETIVEFGVVKRTILKGFDIKQTVYYAEFNWEKIQKYVSNKLIVKPLAKFPGVTRDLALLIDKSVSFNQLFEIAIKADKTIIQNVDLFDVYEGDKLPEDKKSYALRFTLLDENKTLEEKQIEKVMNKLKSSFEHHVGAELR
jgi:phenylalanyl-tRNA synthetase beta chain